MVENALPRRVASMTPLVAALSLHAACGGTWLTRESLENTESRWHAHYVTSYTIGVSVSESDKPLRQVPLEVRYGELVEVATIEDGTLTEGSN